MFGGAILDGEGKMIGSVMLLNDMTQEEAKKYVQSDWCLCICCCMEVLSLKQVFGCRPLC